MVETPNPVVVVIEDDADIARLVRLHLDANGFDAACYTTAEEALASADQRTPCAFLLDVMLPGAMDGLDALRQIRKRPDLHEVPVIIMSARNAEEDRILGLELGADDYVVKPFSPRELVVRLKCLRRRLKPRAPAEIKIRDVVVDTDAMTVTVKGKRLETTKTEFRILEYLMRAPGRVISRADLLNAVRGDQLAVDPRLIDVYVCRLREKMGDNPEVPSYITTVRGMGYRFEMPLSAAS